MNGSAGEAAEEKLITEIVIDINREPVEWINETKFLIKKFL